MVVEAGDERAVPGIDDLGVTRDRQVGADPGDHTVVDQDIAVALG